VKTIRFEAEPQDVLDFLRAQDYPSAWRVEDLRACVMVRIEDDEGYTRGYVWGHFDATGRYLNFHVCANKFTGTWFSRSVFNKFLVLAELMGAPMLRAEPTGPHAARLIRLLKSLGFREDEGALTLDLRNSNGNVLSS
jgi:hypothetical protein